MLPAVKFATKFLKGETFTVDGFEYQFISVQLKKIGQLI